MRGMNLDAVEAGLLRSARGHGEAFHRLVDLPGGHRPGCRVHAGEAAGVDRHDRGAPGDVREVFRDDPSGVIDLHPYPPARRPAPERLQRRVPLQDDIARLGDRPAVDHDVADDQQPGQSSDTLPPHLQSPPQPHRTRGQPPITRVNNPAGQYTQGRLVEAAVGRLFPPAGSAAARCARGANRVFAHRLDGAFAARDCTRAAASGVIRAGPLLLFLPMEGHIRSTFHGPAVPRPPANGPAPERAGAALDRSARPPGG